MVFIVLSDCIKHTTRKQRRQSKRLYGSASLHKFTIWLFIEILATCSKGLVANKIISLVLFNTTHLSSEMEALSLVIDSGCLRCHVNSSEAILRLGCGSRSRAPAWQTQGPGSKPQYCQNKCINK
jgi:hypothetical protein